jgi:hypothetical protein
VEIKLTLSKTHGIAQLSARRLLVLRHGPSARQPGVAIVAGCSNKQHLTFIGQTYLVEKGFQVSVLYYLVLV